MEFMQPTYNQSRLLDECVAACRLEAPDLAEELHTQFSEILCAQSEHCEVCFDIVPARHGLPAIGPAHGFDITSLGPKRVSHEGNPLRFVSATAPDHEPVAVLLWHDHGIVSSVEVEYVGEGHPRLEDFPFPLMWEPNPQDIA
ncbi:hypothetical protein [Timonella sp. A28]|uniref:hypothetical protein n=1 Tax=Timonella sp. A28 TaxID=3442640 RepID=UPI003EB8357F